jgi:hypothetical protein
MTVFTVDTRPSSHRIGPLGFFYLSAATLLVLVVVAVENDWYPWFLARFPDPLAFAAALLLSGIIMIIATRQIFPVARSLAGERNAMQNLRGVLFLYAKEDIVTSVNTVLDCDFGGTTISATFADVRQHLDTSVALDTRPTLRIDDIFESYASRLAVYSPRLSSSVQLLVTLGLLGTITGLVATGTSQLELPKTDDAMKNFMFTLYHGMGVVYVAAIVAWAGAAWLYLFEKIVASSVDELCSEFWSIVMGTIHPVIMSQSLADFRKKQSAQPS